MAVRDRFLFAAACVWWAASAAQARAETPAAAEAVAQQVRPLWEKYCGRCHAGDKPEGKFTAGELAGATEVDVRRTAAGKALRRVESAEMPPAKAPQPTLDERRRLVEYLRLIGGPPRAVLRRLNRVEYERTIRDLLDITADFQDLLPPDSSADGFDNVAQAQHVSSFLLERYLEAADKALALAVANGPQPPLVKKRLDLNDERVVKIATERVFKRDGDAVILFSSSAWNAITVSQFYPPDRGRYRFRIATRAVQSDGKPVTFRVEAGPMLMGTKNHLIGYFDSAAGEPTIVEFEDHLEARSTIRILPFGLANAQTVDKIGANDYRGAGLAIDWVEVEGPLHDAWPPESHRRIFDDLPRAPVASREFRDRVEVASNAPATDATRVLREFARRAFRRPATDDEVARLVTLVEQKMSDGDTFEQAMRAALKRVLISPDFLFFREAPGRLDDYAIASRLSYFLWSAPPDASLLELAAAGKLREPAVLREQVDRMLASPKTAALTENFVGQWLKLRDIDFTEPDRRLYPEYDDLLRAAMVRETELFFEELLKNDLSVLNFVQSDFTLLNERLARHYGVPGVSGHAFRKVPLPPDSHRGGVLTMASVLKVTANGTTTSPVVRGAFVLDRILGAPPPNPPDGVPAVEPDIRGATTIREQMAKHRSVETCASCHVKIDPPGFALESFDVVGGWRDYYRSVGGGKEVTIDGRRMPYARGRDVDPADELPDGRKFANIDEYKRRLLEEPEPIVRAFATKLATYATGRASSATDRAAIDALVEQTRSKNFGLRTLVHALVQSELFQSR